MKVIAYVRVSTDRQELGPEAQRTIITEFAKKHGHVVVAWHEEHISGGADIEERHALMAAIEALSSGMAIVVAKRDRLSRDTAVSGMIKYLIRKRGAVLLSADSNGNGNGDPYAEMLDGMLEVFAQFERALIRMRIVAALDVKRQRGEALGGNAPYGYRVGADGVTLEENEAEQAIIKEARQKRAEGKTIRQIVTELGPVSRAGKLFTVAAVHKMVKQEGR